MAVVNRALADKLYPDKNVIGQRVKAWDITHTIVGVVGDVRRGPSPWEPPAPEMYFSAAQRGQYWRYARGLRAGATRQSNGSREGPARRLSVRAGR